MRDPQHKQVPKGLWHYLEKIKWMTLCFRFYHFNNRFVIKMMAMVNRTFAEVTLLKA